MSGPYQNIPVQPPVQFVEVPQKPYQAQTFYKAQFPIRFFTNGHPGVNVERAMNGNIMGLDFCDEIPTVSTTSNRITLRILWPGLTSWTFNNLSVYDHTYRTNAFTRGQLAETICKHIGRFFQEMRGPEGTGEDSAWALNNIHLDRLYLTELRHVAAGSWQPVLYYWQNA